MSEPLLIAVPAEKVGPVFHASQKLMDMVEAAVGRDRGRFTMEEVINALLDGSLVLWLAWDDDENEPVAMCICGIAEYPEFTSLQIRYVSGADHKRWVDLLDKIEEWASNEGATRSEAWARPGWLKSIAKRGYKKKLIFVEKELWQADQKHKT